MMEARLLKIGDRFYEFKIGLKGLIELGEISNINVEEHLEEVLFWGLWPQALPQISPAERELLTKELQQTVAMIKFPSKQEIDEWYIKALGEIGMPLSTFYCLTPYELDLAYEGYLRKMELAGNLNHLGVLRANNHSDEPISIVKEREVTQGSLEERNAMFSQLGII